MNIEWKNDEFEDEWFFGDDTEIEREGMVE